MRKILDTTIGWPASSNPSDAANWLECKGQTITSAAYPELYAVIGSKVPDYQGRFLRGLGGNSAGLGVVQNGAVESHAHETKGIVQNTSSARQWWVGSGGTYIGGIPTQTSLYGSNETRPINVAVRYLIRAKP